MRALAAVCDALRIVCVSSVGCLVCAACAPAEDPVVVRHPVRQLVVESVKDSPVEVAPSPMVGRGKYGTGKESLAFSRPAVSVARPIVIARGRPTPPPR